MDDVQDEDVKVEHVQNEDVNDDVTDDVKDNIKDEDVEDEVEHGVRNGDEEDDVIRALVMLDSVGFISWLCFYLFFLF